MNKITNTVAEWCQNCGEEVEIPKDKPSKCPSCNKNILPCSMCDLDITDCNPCKFEEYLI